MRIRLCIVSFASSIVKVSVLVLPMVIFLKTWYVISCFVPAGILPVPNTKRIALSDEAEFDRRRCEYIESLGWKVIKYRNSDVRYNVLDVVSDIIKEADERAKAFGVDIKYQKGRSPCGRIEL